MTFQVMFNFLL